MIKAKEVSIRNLTVFVLLSMAVAAGFYLSRTQSVVSQSVPVFMGEEVVVKQVPVVASVVKTAAPAKAVSVPAPAPKTAAPLPIIPPTVTFKVLPLFPSSALEKGTQGIVILSAYIGLTGQPEKVEIKTSSGVSELDESAAKAVSQWQFSPASRGGAALASWFEVPVRFEVK